MSRLGSHLMDSHSVHADYPQSEVHIASGPTHLGEDNYHVLTTSTEKKSSNKGRGADIVRRLLNRKESPLLSEWAAC